MKLNEEQKGILHNYEWDIINNDDGNCAWVSFTPEDGKVFGELCEQFGLTGDEEDIKLLVVATREGD